MLPRPVWAAMEAVKRAENFIFSYCETIYGETFLVSANKVLFTLIQL